MNLHVIDAGHFKLDGGAMFGIVPKVLWQKRILPDANNHIPLAMRCLLVEAEGRLLLIDCGMGNKQDARWQAFYYRHGDGDLLGSIRRAGFSPDEITDVLPSHLHFDHVGGAVCHDAAGERLQLTFRHARYWAHSGQWAWAMQPNPREKASFLPENLLPISESGHLHFLDQQPEGLGFGPQVQWATADGHTEKMLLPCFQTKNKKVVFVADLIPTLAHVPVNYVMGYDVRPLESMNEKERFLHQAAAEGWVLVSAHDPVTEAFTVHLTEKGFSVKESGPLAALL